MSPIPSRRAAKPNIVVILADDMGYGDISCQSVDNKIHTPRMDRLASEGMRFTNTHSASAVCTPSRYALLTGRYCWRSRMKRSVLQGYDAPLIEPHRMTVGSLLQQHGYTTACIGKWHLGFGWRTKDGQVAPWKDGKQVAEAMNIVDYDQPLAVEFRATRASIIFMGFPPRSIWRPTATLKTTGSWKRPPITPRVEIPPDRVLAPGPIAPGFEPGNPYKTSLAAHQIHRMEKHRQCAAPFPLSPDATTICPAPFVKGSSQAGDYGDFIVEIDWAVGQVMDALERNGIADNTLVILTSDNGSPARTNEDDTPYAIIRLYQHYPNGKLRGIKADIWDGGHREPFIVRWPGRNVAPGSVNPEFIGLTDLMATCAGIVGAKLPAEVGEDSSNILPALLFGQRAGAIRPSTIHHSIEGMYAIRRGPWKLILGQGNGGWGQCQYKAKSDNTEGQLYNMDVDVEEKENVYDQHPEVVRNLTALLQETKLQGHS